MAGEVNTGCPRVELFVRSLSPSGQRDSHERLISRLVRLDERNAIDELDVHVWRRRVALSAAGSRTTAGERALSRYGQFRMWADETGRSVDEFFEIRETRVQYTDESRTTLVFPPVVLAEYAGDELRYVTPHRAGGVLHTVRDRLETLEQDPGDDASGSAHAGAETGEI